MIHQQLSGSTNAMFANNCRAIGRPELIDEPCFANNRDRVQHAQELNGIFAAWCAAHPLAAVLAAFEAALVVAGAELQRLGFVPATPEG